MTVPAAAKEKLKEVFPEFYSKGIRIVAMDSKRIREIKVTAGERQISSGQRVAMIPPPPISWKARGTYTDEDGTPINIQYSEGAARNVNGTLQWNSKQVNIEVGDGFTIAKHNEELLFAMYYLCKHLNNTAGTGLGPKFEFDRPEAKAKARIEQSKSLRKIEEFIYEAASSEDVVKARKLLGLNDLANDERNRIDLFEQYKNKNELFKKNCLEFLNYEKGETPKPEEKVEGVADLVNRLTEEGQIRLEADGWHQRSKAGNGTTFKKVPFCATTLTGDDARFFLLDYLKESPQTVAELKS